VVQERERERGGGEGSDEKFFARVYYDTNSMETATSKTHIDSGLMDKAVVAVDDTMAMDVDTDGLGSGADMQAMDTSLFEQHIHHPPPAPDTPLSATCLKTHIVTLLSSFGMLVKEYMRGVHALANERGSPSSGGGSSSGAGTGHGGASRQNAKRASLQSMTKQIIQIEKDLRDALNEGSSFPRTVPSKCSQD
jgi:hypothetical protein